MTREEAIIILDRRTTIPDDNYSWEDINEAIEIAIKALKQEPILDKIRDEILKLDDADYDFEGYYKAVIDALAIIDKYRKVTDMEIHCDCTDEEIAKSFIEDVEAVKDLLPRGESEEV